MHATHKILAAAAGKDTVEAGDIVTAKVDLVGINDVYQIVISSFEEMDGEKIWDPEKVWIFLDHDAPAGDLKVAEAHRRFRRFAREQACHLVEINEGIGHNLLAEWGMAKPGSIIVITDSHTPIHGAYGAFSAGLGATDIAATLIEGTTWFRVPEVVLVRLSGALRPGVMAKDAALHVLGRLGTEFGTYRVIEFSGSVVDAMSMDERMCLTVMATEMGAKATYIQPDATTIADVRNRTDEPFVVHETDPDFVYAQTWDFDLSDLKPQVAVPHSVDNARSLDEVDDLPIDQVFVGSCTGGKFTDIEVVAGILKGRKIATGTRLVVTMATREIVRRSLDLGYYQILLDAGATITNPNCGACSGLLGGIMAAHERCVSTANRNFPGRMGGATDAEIFLVSPRTAAAVALTGRLAVADRL